jgi:hypothetical protein
MVDCDVAPPATRMEAIPPAVPPGGWSVVPAGVGAGTDVPIASPPVMGRLGAEGVAVLAGLTARGGVGAVASGADVGAAGCGVLFTTTAGVGRVEAVAPPAPIPGAAPETSTPSIASFNFVPKSQPRSPFGLTDWTGAAGGVGLTGAGATTARAGGTVGGRAGGAGGVGLTDTGGSTIRPVAMGGVTGRAGAGAAGAAGDAGN